MVELSDEAATLKQKWAEFFDTVARPTGCEACGSDRVAWNGHGTRTASVHVGGRTEFLDDIRCRRVRCGTCRVSWMLRPSGLQARRHYQPCVVEAATSEYVSGETIRASVAQRHGCSRRTLGRWLGRLAAMGTSRLSAWLAALTDRPLRLPLRRVVDLQRKAGTTAGRCRLELAAEVLGLVTALGEAMGLEPPVLGQVEARLAAAQSVIPGVARGSPPR